MYDVTEIDGKRVLTTEQVATAYEVDIKSLQKNFQRHKEKFAPGVHFILLEGEALKAFKAKRQDDSNFKNARSFYLWTEQGAFLLSKSLKGDKAWAAYEGLVASYYKDAAATQAPQPLLIEYDPQRFLELEQRVQAIENLALAATLYSHEQQRLQQAISARVHSMSYKQKERNQLFRQLYNDLKARYSVLSYRDIRRCDLDDALAYAVAWELSDK